MSKSIKLSKKHGVNPTIPICFWCEKEKNEVALLGKLKGDIKAPRSMWIPGDYEPCEECKKQWMTGIVLIEAYENPVYDEKQPAFHGAYPNGRYMVLTENGVRGLFTPETAEQLIKQRMGFMDYATMQAIQQIAEQAYGRNEDEKV